MIRKKRPLIELDTKLEDIPREWLQWIEPRIDRPKDSTCWLWTGACDEKGEPVISSNKIGGEGRTLARLKRVVANMFWEFAKHIDIVHECGVTNCLNPSHFYLSPRHWTQENRDKMVNAKRRNIRDYISRKED